MFNRIRTVLLVDDAPDILFSMKSYLERVNLTVITANHGAEAIRILEKTSVNLLITDFRMPLVDGVELLNWCRENSIHIPVIFTTSEVRLFPKEQIALGDCCAALLRKPVNFETLIAALIEADQRRHVLDCETETTPTH